MAVNVGLYCGWEESFDSLMERMRRATPGLTDEYKSLRFVPHTEPHEAALIYNAWDGPVHCAPGKTYVIIFEPTDILGPDHPWLFARTHPNVGANIYSFCAGTEHRLAMGLHLVQASLTDLVPHDYQRLCSMICSSKTITPYQRKRREVMEALLQTDLPIDFYGRDMEATGNPRVKGEIRGPLKDEALQPYKYVIDFENSPLDVITDKFIDPIFAGSVPITNSTGALQVFPEGSYEYVNFEQSVPMIVWCIRKILESGKHYDGRTVVARESLTRGRLNICEWLHRRLV